MCALKLHQSINRSFICIRYLIAILNGFPAYISYCHLPISKPIHSLRTRYYYTIPHFQEVLKVYCILILILCLSLFMRITDCLCGFVVLCYLFYCITLYHFKRSQLHLIKYVIILMMLIQHQHQH